LCLTSVRTRNMSETLHWKSYSIRVKYLGIIADNWINWIFLSIFFSSHFKPNKQCSKYRSQILNCVKKESTTSSSNKRTKTFYQDYLHGIRNFRATVLNISSKEIISNNTICRKQILKFIWNTWKYWWNETDEENLPVFAQFLWSMKHIFSSFHRKLFLVLPQATIYICSF